MLRNFLEALNLSTPSEELPCRSAEETKQGRGVSKIYELWKKQKFIDAIKLFDDFKDFNQYILTDETPYDIKLIFFNLMCYYLNKNEVNKAYHLLSKFEPIKETPMGKLVFGVYLFTLPKPNKTQAIEYLTVAVNCCHAESDETEKKKTKIPPENHEIRFHALLYRAHLYLKMNLESSAIQDFISLLSYRKISPHRQAVYLYALAMVHRMQPSALTTVQKDEVAEFISEKKEASKVQRIKAEVKQVKEFDQLALKTQIVELDQSSRQVVVTKITIEKQDELIDKEEQVLSSTQEEKALLRLAHRTPEKIGQLLQELSQYQDLNLPLYLQYVFLEIHLFNEIKYKIAPRSLQNSDAIKDQVIHLIKRCADEKLRHTLLWYALIPGTGRLLSEILYYQNNIIGEPSVNHPKGRLYQLAQMLKMEVAKNMIDEEGLKFSFSNLVAKNVPTDTFARFKTALESVSPLLASFFDVNPNLVRRHQMAVKEFFPSTAQYGMEMFDTLKSDPLIVVDPLNLLSTIHMEIKQHYYFNKEQIKPMLDALTEEMYADPINSNTHINLALGYYYASLGADLFFTQQEEYLNKAISFYESAITYAAERDIPGLQTRRDRICFRLAELFYRKMILASQITQADFDNLMRLTDMPKTDNVAIAYAKYLKVCAYNWQPNPHVVFNSQITLLEEAIASSDAFLFRFAMSAIKLKQGIFSPTNKEGFELGITLKIRKAMSEHHLQEPYLRAIFEMRWGDDPTNCCHQYLKNITPINQIYVEPFFEALLSATSNVLMPDYRMQNVNNLLSLIKRIASPTLKIEALVQALSSGQSHLLGRFYHPDGQRLSLGYDSHLSAVVVELEKSLEDIRDKIATSTSEAPWLVSWRLKTTLDEDKFLQKELTKHNVELYQLLRKMVGLQNAVIHTTQSTPVMFKPQFADQSDKRVTLGTPTDAPETPGALPSNQGL